MGRPWIFDLGAFFYGIMTAQETWRSSCIRLAQYVPNRNEPRILDLGCGPGVSTIVIAQSRREARVFGLDLAPRMLGEAKEYTNQAGLDGSIGYVNADAARLPFPTGSFDAVTGHSFLYLVPDRRAVLAESLRVLRPGGRIASMEPRSGNTHLYLLARRWRNWRFVISVLLWRIYSRFFHTQFTEESFNRTLVDAGFQKPLTELVLDGFGIIGSGEK